MSTKKIKTQEEIEAEEKAKAEKEAAKEAAKLQKTNEVKKIEVCFDSKKLSGGNGVWRYIENPELIDREFFHQARAKDFGIKQDDIVHVVSNGDLKTIGV